MKVPPRLTRAWKRTTKVARRWWKAIAPRGRAERWHAVLALGVVVGLAIAIWSARSARAAAPRYPFAVGVVDLAGLFRADVHAEGSALSLRDVYDEGFRIWSKQAGPAAQRLRGGGELQDRLRAESRRAKRTSLLDLERVIAMESGGKIEVGTNRSGYTGLFQLGPSACIDAGADFDTVSKDWRKNLDVGVRFVEILHARLSDALAKDPELRHVRVDPFLLYLAHQQGVTGCMQILRVVHGGEGGRTAANKNLANNLLPGSGLWKALTKDDRKPTVLEFFVFFRGAFDSVAAALP